MLLEIEVKKRLNGVWFNYPSLEFNGMTARQILVFIDRQDMIMKINQGMDKSIYIVGREETLAEYSGNRKHAFITVKEALALWNNSPLLCIVWPPFGTDPVPKEESAEEFQEILSSLASRSQNQGNKKGQARGRIKKAA